MSVPGSTRVTLLDQGRCRANMVGFNTIVIREFSRIIRIWGQTLVPPAITATLYFVIFGSLGFINVYGEPKRARQLLGRHVL